MLNERFPRLCRNSGYEGWAKIHTCSNTPGLLCCATCLKTSPLTTLIFLKAEALQVHPRKGRSKLIIAMLRSFTRNTLAWLEATYLHFCHNLISRPKAPLSFWTFFQRKHDKPVAHVITHNQYFPLVFKETFQTRAQNRTCLNCFLDQLWPPKLAFEKCSKN